MSSSHRRFYCVCKMDFCEEGDLEFCRLGFPECSAEFESQEGHPAGWTPATQRALCAFLREAIHDRS